MSSVREFMRLCTAVILVRDMGVKYAVVGQVKGVEAE